MMGIMKTLVNVTISSTESIDEIFLAKLALQYSVEIILVSTSNTIHTTNFNKNEFVVQSQVIPSPITKPLDILKIQLCDLALCHGSTFVPIVKKQVLSRLEYLLHSADTVAFVNESPASPIVSLVKFSLLCSHVPFTCLADVNCTNSKDNGLEMEDRTIDCSDLISLRNFGNYTNVDKHNEQLQINSLLQAILERTHWLIPQDMIELTCRCAAAMRKDARFQLSDASVKRKLGLTKIDCIEPPVAVNENANAEHSEKVHCSPLSKRKCVDSSRIGVKEMDCDNGLSRIGMKEIDSDKGLSVIEFFSGIGGMRLALPEAVHGVLITSIEAYDCSAVANQIYLANFHSHAAQKVKSSLRNIMIECLKLEDVDNHADIWTMSPPCQPFTTTKGAHRLDEKDNRSKGLFHLMALLRSMKKGPRWIVLENVKGFLGSAMLAAWKETLRACGYMWRQYLLSPATAVGIPNHRSRYYMIAEHYSSPGAARLVTKQPSFASLAVTSNPPASTGETPGSSASGGVSPGECEADGSGPVPAGLLVDGEMVYTQFPVTIARKYPAQPITLGSFLAPARSRLSTTAETSRSTGNSEDYENLTNSTVSNPVSPYQSLYLSASLLTKPWLAGRMSCAGDHDNRTYCFTKGYNRIVDKSSGSCFLDSADGPLQNDPSALNRDNLLQYFGRLRLFHPKEIFALFGFPIDFIIPDSMPIRKQYACIGNSVNVVTVREVMNCLFDYGIDLDQYC